MKKRFLFDLDDTLIWTTHDYSYPLLEFARFVIERVGPKSPNVPAILNLQESIDDTRIKKWLPLEKGFSKERFPTSMAETYRKICQPLGIVDKKGEELAYKIGTKAFDVKRWQEQGLVPEAEDVLKYLRKKGDELYVLTKGDREVQQMKIDSKGLEPLVDKVCIEPDKNSEIILKYCNGIPKENIWLVGDSKDSDVLPSIEAGIGIIYLPMPNWKFENSEKEIPPYERLITLKNISQIKEIYNKL